MDDRWTVLAVMAVIATSSSVHADISGTYRSAVGPVKITEADDGVLGKLVGKSPCGFKRGTVVLRGDRLDDSITGEVKLCKVGAGCKGHVNGLAMLLVTRGGSVLSGYVHADTGACKSILSNSAIAFKRRNKQASRRQQQASSGQRSNNKTTQKPRVRRPATERRQQVARQRNSNAGQDKADGSEPAPNTAPGRADEKQEASSPTDTAVPENEHPQQKKGRGDRNPKSVALDDGEPPVSPGENARMRAEALAQEGMRLLGRPSLARQKFEEAVEADPAYAEGWLGIGVTDYLNDRYDDAEDSYKRALEANPAMPDAYYNLACLYALRDDKDKAFNFLRVAVLNGFVDFDKVDQDPDLNKLHDDERYARFRAGDLW